MNPFQLLAKTFYADGVTTYYKLKLLVDFFQEFRKTLLFFVEFVILVGVQK